jgi:predicted MFS family arabinose efflux permease
MLIVALPGLLLAVLVKITMREPKRSHNNTEMKEGLGATFKYLSRKKTFNWTIAGAVSMGFAIYAFMTWMPSYLIRQHQLSTGEVGTIVGLSAGIAGSLGVFAGGYLADKWAKTKPSNLMLPPIVCTLLFFPAAVSALYVDSATAAIILLVPAYGLTLAHTGPTWAVLQNVAPENMRAMAAAIMLLGVNLLGPQSVGILSDLFQANFPAGSSLKFALAISMFPAILASLCYLMAGRALNQDIEDDQPFAATKN